jgi:hypothetical protein
MQLVVTHACYRLFNCGWDLVLVANWTLFDMLMFMSRRWGECIGARLLGVMEAEARSTQSPTRKEHSQRRGTGSREAVNVAKCNFCIFIRTLVGEAGLKYALWGRMRLVSPAHP